MVYLIYLLSSRHLAASIPKSFAKSKLIIAHILQQSSHLQHLWVKGTKQGNMSQWTWLTMLLLANYLTHLSFARYQASYGNAAFWLMCVCVCVCVYVCVFVRPLVDISKQSLKGEVEGTKGDLQSTLHQNRDDGVRLHCAFFYKARWMLETFHHGNLENIRIVIETRQGEYQIPESIETVKVLVSVDELPLPVGTYLLSKLIRFFRISPSSDKVLGRKPNPRRPRPTKKVAEA